MTKKQQRLRQVYDHLRAHYGVHTQIDFAEAIHVTRPALSSAMNGNESYLTQNLFQKICAAYPGVFNLGYLLTGEGCLLTDQETVISEELAKNEKLKNQAKMVDELLRSKQETIDEQRERIADLKKTIALLEQQLEEYRTRSASISGIVREKNAFELGVPEPLEPPQHDR